MKKIIVLTILALVVVSSIFSFDFGGGIGVGLLVGNPKGLSGGFYCSSEKMFEQEYPITNCQFLLDYRNFVVGLGLRSLGEPNDTNTAAPTNTDSINSSDEFTISLGYNINLNTLITPSVFLECGASGLSVSVVAMFNWYPHKHDYSIKVDHKDSTCTVAGYTTYKCSKCGVTNTEIIRKHNFYWEPSSVYIDFYEERCRDCGKYSGRIMDRGKIYEL